jgi:hypothetical protein
MQNRKSCKPKYKYKYLEMKIKKRLRTDKKLLLYSWGSINGLSGVLEERGGKQQKREIIWLICDFLKIIKMKLQIFIGIKERRCIG